MGIGEQRRRARVEKKHAFESDLRPERIAIVVLLASFALLVAGVVGIVVWSLGREAPPPPVVSYEAYRPAWESAMAKAGVEATFPPAPVDVGDVHASGMRSFVATFTPEEITALLAMYRFDYATDTGDVSLMRPSVDFPAPGRASVAGSLAFQGTSYYARLTAPVRLQDGHVAIDSDQAELVVEGFTVTGERRSQALRMVGSYVEAFLKAAPRLTIERAEIVQGGVSVEGMAPQRIEHPSAN